MRSRKLFHLLSRMPKDERKLFQEFLRSPLHSRRPKLAKLVEEIETTMFTETEVDVSPEKFYGLIYPDKQYDANNLNRLISVITSELRSFLALIRFQNDKAGQYVNLVRELNIRKWHDVVPKTIRDVRVKMERDVPLDENYHYQMLQIAYEEMRDLVENMPKRPGTIYQECIDRVQDYQIAAATKFVCLARFHDTNHDTIHRIEPLSTEIKKAFEDSELSRPLTEIYHQLLRYFENPKSTEGISNFNLLIPKYLPDAANRLTNPVPFHEISSEELESILFLGLNVFALKMNQEGVKWLQAYDKIYGMAIRSGVLLEGGTFNSRSFINHIKLLSKENFTILARTFFDEFSGILTADPNGIVTEFGLGIITFFEGKYEEALGLFLRTKRLTKHDSDQTILHELRVLLIMSWLELNDYESMVYEINSFRTMLRRNTQLGKNRQKSYLDFCRYIMRLERIFPGAQIQKKEGLNKLKISMLNRSNFTGRDWILSKIELALN